MEHNWIKYENKIDEVDEISYYCLTCNQKIFTAREDDGIIKQYSDMGNKIYNCEEFIIKNIIE